ncbi:hypothetical protein ADUPG1_001021, partial [Aduncisulcus paluster]
MENNNEAWGLTKDGTPLDNKGIIKPVEEALPKVYYGSTPKGVRGVDYREYVDNLIEELDGTHDKEREEVREHLYGNKKKEEEGTEESSDKETTVNQEKIKGEALNASKTKEKDDDGLYSEEDSVEVDGPPIALMKQYPDALVERGNFLNSKRGQRAEGQGCVQVAVELAAGLKKAVYAIMDTGSDISLVSEKWLTDVARCGCEDPWVLCEKRYSAEQVGRWKDDPVMFKTLTGYSTVEEIVLLNTIVLRTKKGKETQFKATVHYYVTDLLPVSTPLLIGRRDLENMGITLN